MGVNAGSTTSSTEGRSPETHVLLVAGHLAGDERLRVRGLAERLVHRGHRVDLVALSDAPPVPTRRPGSGLGLGAGSGPERAARAFDWPGLGSVWLRPLATRGFPMDDLDERPEVILTLSVELAESTRMLAKHWRIPYLLSVEEFLPPGRSLMRSRSHCRAVVAASLEVGEQLVARAQIPRQLIRVVPPGLPLCPTRNRALDPGRIAVVGTAGFWEPGGGQSTFLAAAARVCEAQLDVEFILAGQGAHEPFLRRSVDRLGIADRVTFAETKQSTEPFWGVLDVYCHPSVVPTVGRPLINAMAHGVPVVASDVEGLRALVSDRQTGLLIPPGDCDPMADAMLDLLADAVEAHRMSSQGRRRVVELFDPEREADSLSALLTAVARDLSLPGPEGGYVHSPQPERISVAADA